MEDRNGERRGEQTGSGKGMRGECEGNARGMRGERVGGGGGKTGGFTSFDRSLCSRGLLD